MSSSGLSLLHAPRRDSPRVRAVHEQAPWGSALYAPQRHAVGRWWTARRDALEEFARWLLAWRLPTSAWGNVENFRSHSPHDACPDIMMTPLMLGGGRAWCVTWWDGGSDMDAGTIYRRLPGLTEGEAVALALAYHLGEADAHAERATGVVSGVVPTWDLPGAGRDAGRGRMHGLLGTLGGALDAQALARLVEWYAVGWDKVAAGDE